MRQLFDPPAWARADIERGATWNPITGRLSTPEERAYWGEVRQASSARAALLPPEPAERCLMCDGIGWVRADVQPGHELFGKTIPCPNPECPTRQKEDRQRFAKLTSTAQIPPAYKDLTFGSWRAIANEVPEIMAGKWDAYGAALAFFHAASTNHFFSLAEAAAEVNADPAVADELAQEQRNSIVFFGANGVGKTSLAVSIANALIATGRVVKYVRLDDYFEALRRTYGKDADEHESDVMDEYRTVPVLIIDELGAGQITPWKRDKVGALINARYTSKMPTIVTTNTGYDAFCSEEVWGLTTGVRAQAMAHWIEMGGEVLRPRLGKVVSR